MSAQTFEQRQHGTPTAPMAGDAGTATEDEDIVTENESMETETR
jgi:L-serine deaminase